MRLGSYWTVETTELTALDLRIEVPEDSQVQGIKFNITKDGDFHPERGEALYCPNIRRIGIAWGGPASWGDTIGEGLTAIEEALDCWLNRPEEWGARN